MVPLAWMGDEWKKGRAEESAKIVYSWEGRDGEV